MDNILCKNAVFSWRPPFQTKLLFFQTIESAKRTFAARAGSGKPALLQALFLENEKQNNRKNCGAMFSHYLEAKKKWPKMSLTLFMQLPLQLKRNVNHGSSGWSIPMIPFLLPDLGQNKFCNQKLPSFIKIVTLNPQYFFLDFKFIPSPPLYHQKLTHSFICVNFSVVFSCNLYLFNNILFTTFF